MSRKSQLIIILLLAFSSTYSQPSSVTVNIKPDSSITSGSVSFRCTITNPTKKNYRYFNFFSDCNNRFNPTLWKIVIKKDSLNYMDCSLNYSLVHWAVEPEVTIRKNSVRTFDFCLNFNKLLTGSEFSDIFKHLEPKTDIMSYIKNYTNKSYGKYEVQIFYLKDPFDPKNPLSLISNWSKIEYVRD